MRDEIREVGVRYTVVHRIDVAKPAWRNPSPGVGQEKVRRELQVAIRATHIQQIATARERLENRGALGAPTLVTSMEARLEQGILRAEVGRLEGLQACQEVRWKLTAQAHFASLYPGLPQAAYDRTR